MVLGPIDGLWELCFFQARFSEIAEKNTTQICQIDEFFFQVFGTIGVETGPIGQPTAAKFELEVAASVPGGPGAYFGLPGQKTNPGPIS